ncbi:hypothetical protein [Streptomyces sp. NPDC001404]|uniref:hypothetical protein n=1 Tax=Streptomyces sp. NPDC001404 TaxID=3364571 RepID=UPI0036A0D166
MTADWEPETDDIKAMRSENGGSDLRAFLRTQIATGRARRTPPPASAPRLPAGRRPGAWPPGTRPPGPAPSTGTHAQWQQALHDYREHLRHRMARDDDTAQETP